MNGLSRLLLLLLVVVSAAACRPAQSEAEARFCEDLDALETAVTDLRQLPETASLREVNMASEAVYLAWTDLLISGRELSQTNLSAAERPMADLRSQVEAAPSMASTAEAIRAVRRAAAGIRNPLDELRASANCR